MKRNDARMRGMVQKLRESYKPEVIKLLYVAESPPANDTFFYRGNSNLFDALHKVFIEVFGDSFKDANTFLRFFKSHGCYLDDLWLQPINDLTRSERKHYRERGASPLATRISEMTPKAIVILMLGIEDYVQRAISESGIKSDYMFATPFPSHSPENVKNCIERNIEILRSLDHLGILCHA